MKKYFFALLAVLALLAVSLPVFAVDEEPEDSPKAVTDETVTESLKETLEEVATEERLEKAKDVLSKKEGFFAYVGTITDIEDDLLVIETKKGEKKAQITDDSTLVLYENKKESPIKLEDVETNSYAIAMGTMEDDEVIEVIRMMVSEKPSPPPQKKVVFGKIEEVDGKKVKIKNEEAFEFDIPEDLNLVIFGVKGPEIDDIEIEDKVILALQKAEAEDDFSLSAMFVIPGKHSPESEENKVIEESAPSANSGQTPSSKTASPSAKEE